MAEGDPFDGNLPAVVIQLDDVDELLLTEFWPQYVINATVIDRDIWRTLPQICIPRHFTALNTGFFGEQPGTSDLVNNSEDRPGGSRAPSDQSSGSKIETRLGLKRKRKTSGMSECRKSKRTRLRTPLWF